MIALPLVLAALIGVARTPAAPTVGDPVSLAFPADVRRIAFEPQEGFEVVTTSGNRATIRFFRLEPMELRGTIERDGGRRARFSGLRIAVRSVLEPRDKREPAPLQPPLPLPSERGPAIAIAIAAAVALVAWLLLLLRSRREVPAVVRETPPDIELLAALEQAMRLATLDERLIGAADAVRRFLARVDAAAPRSLTTTELLRGLQEHQVPPAAVDVIRDLLRAADEAKFSPWGADVADDRPLVHGAASLREAFAPAKEGRS